MFDISKKFRVSIPGRGWMSLSPNDHVTSGGEGHVYRKGPVALKIWDDLGHAAHNRMHEKVRLLATLRHTMIVVPEEIAFDVAGNAIGYVMPWVEGGWALPLAFTNEWRGLNGFGDAESLSFASRMRDVVSFVHSRGAILGDGNELNILAIGTEPRYIDVDPWVLPGFPGDKIMPTVRDWHSAPFSKEADWFAWGIVTFQLLAGVHPYRATHPGFGRGDMEGRMKANASVFDPGVRLSPAVRSISSIPAHLLEWYRATFANGNRTIPPDPAASTFRNRAITKASENQLARNLSIKSVYTLRGRPLRVVAPDILMLEGGFLVSLGDGRGRGRVEISSAVSVVPDGTSMAIFEKDGRILFRVAGAGTDVSSPDVEAGLSGIAVWGAGNRLFIVVPDGLLEVRVTEIGSRFALIPGRKWSLNANSTMFGDGIALYDALGAKFVAAPFGLAAVAIIRVRELDGLKPLSMIRRGNVAVMSLIDKGGSYKRAVIVFDADYGSCKVTLGDADDGSLPDTVTETGVIVRFNVTGKLELTVPASGGQREADAGDLSKGRLFSGPSGVFLARGLEVSKLSLA